MNIEGDHIESWRVNCLTKEENIVYGCLMISWGEKDKK